MGYEDEANHTFGTISKLIDKLPPDEQETARALVTMTLKVLVGVTQDLKFQLFATYIEIYTKASLYDLKD